MMMSEVSYGKLFVRFKVKKRGKNVLFAYSRRKAIHFGARSVPLSSAHLSWCPDLVIGIKMMGEVQTGSKALSLMATYPHLKTQVSALASGCPHIVVKQPYVK